MPLTQALMPPAPPTSSGSQAHRALRAFRKCNAALHLAASETDLLRDVCRIIVEVGGYHLAWVGYAEADSGKVWRPVAQAGFGDGCLEQIKVAGGSPGRGREPMDAAIRTGRPAVVRNVPPGPTASRRGQSRHGLGAVAAFPLGDRGRSFGALGVYAAEAAGFAPDELSLLEDLASNLAYGVKVLESRDRRRQAEAALQESWQGTITALATAGEMRDSYTASHQQRVALLSETISRKMGLSKHQTEGVRLAGILHDIGKIRVPAEILSQTGELSELEMGLIRLHPEIGYKILKPVKFPWPIAQIVLQHHERLDGSGYPQGLAGDEILLEARILAVADVVEAMATDRPYRRALRLDEATTEITRNRQTLYDPEAVDACLAILKSGEFSLT